MPLRLALPLLFCAILFTPAASRAAGSSNAVAQNTSMQRLVSETAKPVIQYYQIPGMAIGIIINGQRHVFNYGLASKADGTKIDAQTLFEIGSISKVFAASLVEYEQARGQISLNGTVGDYLPALKTSPIGKVSLLQLGTYTPGGMPLEVPANLKNDSELLDYLKSWHPAYPPGTMRTYSNMSIGLMGFIAARQANAPYAEIVQTRIFPAFGMAHSFMNVPPAQMRHYAQGYRRNGQPIRQVEDILGPEAYGVRATADDMLRLLQANMPSSAQSQEETDWRAAAWATHKAYFQVGNNALVQDLVWEELPLPASLASLQAENSESMGLQPHPAKAITPVLPPRGDVLLNKTGSTNGFAAYTAFIPADGIGIVVLANRNYPNTARIKIAYDILAKLDPARFGN